MKAAIKFLFITILVCSALILYGCGTPINTQSKPQQQVQTVEEKVEQFAKMSCASPASYKKVGYTANEKGGFAKLDFTSANKSGEQVPSTMYFSISKDQIALLKTDGISEEFLKDIEKNQPDNFSKDVAVYRNLKKLSDIMYVEYPVTDYEFEFIEEDGTTYYKWKRLINLISATNGRIKNYKEAYDKAPDLVKKYFEKPPEYFKVILNGTPDSWTGAKERTDTYPDK